MADLFTRTEVDFGGAMHAQTGVIVPNKGLTGVLMQNFSIQYQQQVSRIYELGRSQQKTKMYYIGGRASGSLSAAHVIGPGVSMKTFYDNFSDVCQAGSNDCTIKLGPNICGVVGGGGGNTEMTYIAKFCVLVGIGLSVSAQDFVFNENSQLMFSGLEFNPGQAGQGAGQVPVPAANGTLLNANISA